LVERFGVDRFDLERYEQLAASSHRRDAAGTDTSEDRIAAIALD
jgi:hypothetical protein